MEIQHIDALKHDDNARTKLLYGRYRDEFFAFSKKYNIDGMDSADVYQEAFIAIRKHAISGRLYTIESSFKTYLFGIAKHLIYNKLRYYATQSSYNSRLHNIDTEFDVVYIDDEKELTEEQRLLRHHFNQLGKSCKQMLTLSFYRGLTNEEIAKKYGYDSEAVVRSQKSRCLKTLKNLIKKPQNDN